MEDNKILISDVIRINSIFSNNNWHKNHGCPNVFDSYVEMLAGFSEPQKELIFELSETYLWVTFSDYFPLLVETLKLVDIQKLETINRIVVFPIIKPEDIGHVKSSAPLIYMFKGVNFASSFKKNVTIEVLDSFTDFVKFKFNKLDLLFLVDDFIGSGETLNATLLELKKNVTLEKGQINILALVIQSEVLSFIQTENISLYSLYKRTKGISDKYHSPELEIRTNTMKELEQLIPGNKFFSFGYNQSEALVTMNRTPDNTFPIFWKNHKKKGKTYKAPFLRN